MILRYGHTLSVSSVNSMLSMYLSFGDDRAALSLFEETRAVPRNLLTFNTMLWGLGRIGRGNHAIIFLKEMKQKLTMVPTEVTFSSLLISSPTLLSGRHLHCHALRSGYHPPFVPDLSNAAITMYSNHHDLCSAVSIFSELTKPDLISWNSLLSAFSRGPCPWTAPLVLTRMMRHGFQPDEFTICTLLTTYESSAQVESLLTLTLKSGTIGATRVANALISAFFKTGRVETAVRVFWETPSRDVVSFNSIISGFFQTSRPTEALAAFSELVASGISPDARTLTAVAESCGREVHTYAVRRWMADVRLWNAIVSFYAKAGEVGSARTVFERMGERTTVSWNTLITAYARHGDVAGAADLLRVMRVERVDPDEVTLAALITAYAHVGMVDEGVRTLFSMTTKLGFVLTPRQVSAVVDLLTRAGHLDEAESLVTARVGLAGLWPVLGACVVRNDVRLGRLVAERILEEEYSGSGGSGSAVYVQLANLYTAFGEWEAARMVRKAVDGVLVRKPPGGSIACCLVV